MAHSLGGPDSGWFAVDLVHDRSTSVKITPAQACTVAGRATHWPGALARRTQSMDMITEHARVLLSYLADEAQRVALLM